MSALITVISFLVVLSILIGVHEWGHYRMAALLGVRVIRFSLGFGKPLLRWTPKRQPLLDGQAQQTEFVLAALPFGGYVKMQDEREPDQPPIAARDLPHSFNRKPLWVRAAIVMAGPLANLVLAVILFAAVHWVGMTLPAAIIEEVRPDGAAAQAQLQVDDLVLAVDDRVITDSVQLRELIRASNQGRAQNWLINRAGVQRTVVITPQVMIDSNEFLGEESIGRVGAVIGSDKAMVRVRLGPIEGLVTGIQRTWEYSALTIKTLARMVTGRASLKNLTGPVTVAEYSGKTASMGLESFMFFLALMSVSLGVLNLLPLPMLDGGHLMYYLWELLTGKAVSAAWLDKLQRAGFALLILLTVLALYNDIVRVFGLNSFFH